MDPFTRAIQKRPITYDDRVDLLSECRNIFINQQKKEYEKSQQMRGERLYLWAASLN